MLEQKTLRQLATILIQGDVTSAALVTYYLERIQTYDQHFHSILLVNQEAKALAAQLDQERIKQGRRSVLHGIPFIVKDNIDVKGMPTTGGSPLLKNLIAKNDAWIIQQLKKAGAIVLAKANLSEFAASYGRLGYISLGGLTRNPFHDDYNASGSSSGSAVAVALDFAPFSLGTDTSGSVRGPANNAGLVGLRPTHGSFEMTGVMPSALSFDTLGFFTRTTDDLSLLMSVIKEEKLAYQKNVAKKTFTFITNYSGDNEEVDDTIFGAMQKIREKGHDVGSYTLPKGEENVWNSLIDKHDAESKRDLESYLNEREGTHPKTINHLIEQYEQQGIPINPARLQAFQRVVKMESFRNTSQYEEIILKQQQIQERLNEQFEQGVDAFLFPTMLTPATLTFDHKHANQRKEKRDPFSASYLGSFIGYPEITIPVGFNKAGLPIGLSFLGKAHSEGELVSYASIVEYTKRFLPKQ
ncbi:amidase [Geomicrobium sp. JCM 19038]|uniref:amidase n=1 Tax=Geomicrobium sp. JCM 19038 TaxID=1460635 RepID=UPI00045F4090|nr:amidase [Geomicrobium sp. JCM 19038]GAK08655.1 glutamyl-tRNA(Gln) amidotransferase subunit A-like protein [Geomicrobium sp. JCM 19038]